MLMAIHIVWLQHDSHNNKPTMADKIDKIDSKILKILQDNSKITNLDLSKRIGLSPAPTLERVKKLVSEKLQAVYDKVKNADDIIRIGIIKADKKTEAFRLEIDYLEFE